MPKTPRVLSKKLKDTIAKMYRNGDPLREIKIVTGVGESIIYRALEESGVPRRGRGNYTGNGTVNQPEPGTPRKKRATTRRRGSVTPAPADKAHHNDWVLERAIGLLRRAARINHMSEAEQERIGADIVRFVSLVSKGGR